jgi:VIT1/CCC1 family predicted Fe2+/Mn2+ transporter
MERVLQASGTVAPTVALQSYAIGTGLAQGAAGMYLAKELSKAEEVPVNYVAGATLIGVLLAFVPVLLLLKGLRR